ncbi:MAG TPA: hypothetical protein PLV41_02400 [Miltoncostaeales bacterium]|nr:hypothetical protein [Miltoncostaeales bacterium]
MANCSSVFTIPKAARSGRRGTLDPGVLVALDSALRLSLELD